MNQIHQLKNIKIKSHIIFIQHIFVSLSAEQYAINFFCLAFDSQNICEDE